MINFITRNLLHSSWITLVFLIVDSNKEEWYYFLIAFMAGSLLFRPIDIYFKNMLRKRFNIY